MINFDHFPIATIKAGDLVWECEDGQDALLLALFDPTHAERGTRVETVDIATGKIVRLYENERSCGYGPKLYHGPQYTRPDWAALLPLLAAVLREHHTEELSQAAAREAGLQLAATQHSESRDRWKIALKAAQAEIAQLRTAISEVLCIVERGGQNGIEVSERVKACLFDVDRRAQTAGLEAQK